MNKFNVGDFVEVVGDSSGQVIGSRPMGYRGTITKIEHGVIWLDHGNGTYEGVIKLITKSSMNNLEKAKRAIKGTKEYKVYLTEKSCYDVIIEAKDEGEAENKAREMLEDGELIENGGGGIDIDQIELRT